jgi:hypothetical protein
MYGSSVSLPDPRLKPRWPAGLLFLLLVCVVSFPGFAATSPTLASAPMPLPGAGEKITGFLFDSEGARALIQKPEPLDPDKPTRLVIYLLPNGSTAEETMGCTCTCTLDWHYGIQHIAAQTRRLRELLPAENIVTACLGNGLKSWPAWRKAHADEATTAIPGMVASLGGVVPDGSSIDLVAHSGGGSFIFGYLNSQKAIPANVHSITFLDATYSYDDTDGHGDKLLAWLAGDSSRHLVVVAYDDRRITLNGKLVVSPTGGTWRSCDRMIARFDKATSFTETRSGDLITSTGMNGQIVIVRNTNPDNKILHTVLVERNGFIFGELGGKNPTEKADQFWTADPAYRKLISNCSM